MTGQRDRNERLLEAGLALSSELVDRLATGVHHRLDAVGRRERSRRGMRQVRRRPAGRVGQQHQPAQQGRLPRAGPPVTTHALASAPAVADSQLASVRNASTRPVK